MSDLICRKTMQRCQHPGMCSTHGGCQPDNGFESGHLDLGKFVDWVWSLKAERDQLKAELAQMTQFRDNAANHMRRIRAEATKFEKERDALRKDAERYRWLRDQHPNAFHLERNAGNSVNYCTVAQWIEDNPEWFEGTPADDLAKMAQTNSHWQIQIYPDTPIGFHVTSRATLDEVIDAVKAEESAL